MAIGRTNAVSGGGGGVGAVLTVTAPAGVTVSVSKDGKTKTKTANADGLAVFTGLETGTWTLTITDGVQTSTKPVVITTDYSIAVSFNAIPVFTYDGDYEITDDDDNVISVSKDNWKIRFLTSGTLIFQALNGSADGIDVFCVGGGGGGCYKLVGDATGGGGGGGWKGFSAAKGGSGGGGDGGAENEVGGNGSVNTGGGGGGGTGTDASAGSKGGSGIVIIRNKR